MSLAVRQGNNFQEPFTCCPLALHVSVLVLINSSSLSTTAMQAAAVAPQPKLASVTAAQLTTVLKLLHRLECMCTGLLFAAICSKCCIQAPSHHSLWMLKASKCKSVQVAQVHTGKGATTLCSLASSLSMALPSCWRWRQQWW